MKRIPKNHRHCNACGGNGLDAWDRVCAVCKGKGYYSASDINSYHTKYPSVCKMSCGEKHRKPDLRPWKEIEADFEKVLARANKLLNKLNKWEEERLKGCKCPDAHRKDKSCPIHGNWLDMKKEKHANKKGKVRNSKSKNRQRKRKT